ncbi:PepSY-associated TM helix domain-containing protein [Brevundimonas balnearis]|uniref:PepSY-associated TM helix domain-containing protein n=1 Tax=Brevundimonas balnearis TaxID=1572858 RepID=A0ABV6QY22_9CAUL
MARFKDVILSDAYRVVWRWHFYSGLLVLPFLMLLALTGGLYLFKAEIDDAERRGIAAVAAGPERVPAERWLTAAREALPGEPVAVLVPSRADRAVEVAMRPPEGPERTVFIDPYDGEVQGTAGPPLSETFKRIHSLSILGGWANILIEIVAGWAMILVATGLYLWWPRARGVGVVSLTARDPARRPFWRDVHAITGVFAGGVIFFLAFTGMPWSAVWGDTVLGAMRTAGLGRPPPPVASSWEHAGHEAPRGVGWTLQGETLDATPGAVDLDAAVAQAEAQGLANPYRITLPSSPGQAVVLAHQNTRVEDGRTLYLESDGRLIGDIRFDQYGWGARAFEWGVLTHQGTQYGQINRLIMLTGCIAVWVLGVSAMVMWWKRRPKGRLAAPVAPPGPRARVAVLGIVLPLAILYPLTGLSLVAAVLIDRLWTRLRPAVAR